MSKLTQIVVLFFILNCYAQKQITIKGSVFSTNTPLNQVHIYNKNTAKGTLSNSNGEFEIDVYINDVLVINVMPFREKRITIQEEEINNQKIRINLKENITTLDLVEVSNKKLTGNLVLDSKKVPLDVNQQYKIIINMEETASYSFSESGSGIDRGSLEVINGGMNNFSGGNILGVVGLLVDVIKPPKKNIRKKPNQFTEETPMIMRKELGDKYFIKELKIPKPHIDDFLEEYCKAEEFIKLYEENKIIECIEFLIEKNKLRKYCLNSN